jgi:hypothetical protein
MNPLEKELIKKGNKTIDESEIIVNDVKLLLETNAQEERRVLASIGLDNDIKFAEDKNADILTRKSTSSKLGVPVVHINEITGLCKDYNLQMQPARNYIGAIPNETGAELNRFCKEKNIPLPSNSSYSRFYIIAPPVLFKEYRSIGTIIGDAFNSYSQEKERKRLSKMIDPILVYQTDDSNYYAIIKSWGSDFTLLRRIKGFFTNLKVVKTLMILFNILLSIALYKISAFSIAYFYAKDQATTANSAWTLIGILIAFTIAVFAGIYYFDSDAIRSRKRIVRELSNENPIKLR